MLPISSPSDAAETPSTSAAVEHAFFTVPPPQWRAIVSDIRDVVREELNAFLEELARLKHVATTTCWKNTETRIRVDDAYELPTPSLTAKEDAAHSNEVREVSGDRSAFDEVRLERRHLMPCPARHTAERRESLGASEAVPQETRINGPFALLCGRDVAQLSKNGYSPVRTCDDDDTSALLSQETTELFTEPSSRAFLYQSSKEATDPEAAARLEQEIANLEVRQVDLTNRLDDLDVLWRNRRKPFADELESYRAQSRALANELEIARMPRKVLPPPPGPHCMNWVEGDVFAIICNMVVCLNLSSMALASEFDQYAARFRILDHIALAWYVGEFTVRAIYFQQQLLCGELTVVWWSWMDLVIVVSGIVDQWLMPLWKADSGVVGNASWLRFLRVLRAFRMIRFLKIVRPFLQSDLSWTEGAVFETFMALVIGINTFVMALELDIKWFGWTPIECFFLAVYTFELALRLKQQGTRFFTDTTNLVWNYLDLIMVLGGTLDLYLLPLILFLEGLFADRSSNLGSLQSLAMLQMLRILRIFRVLRLVRLLRMVRPLHTLLVGVIESFRAMQWMMILVLGTLYACAIVFTSLVGKKVFAKTDQAQEQALQFFGSVPLSMYSLFRLMNGETVVVQPITNDIKGQLLFVSFMVCAKWAILAILTSVVADSMLTASAKAKKEDEKMKNDKLHMERSSRLKTLFREIDQDGDGTINTAEWRRILDDRGLSRELCDATGLGLKDLDDYFRYLSVNDREHMKEEAFRQACMSSEKRLDYETFISILKDEDVLADKRSVLQVTSLLKKFASHMDLKFEEASVELSQMARSKEQTCTDNKIEQVPSEGTDIRRNLRSLLDHPSEPTILAKGETHSGSSQAAASVTAAPPARILPEYTKNWRANAAADEEEKKSSIKSNGSSIIASAPKRIHVPHGVLMARDRFTRGLL